MKKHAVIGLLVKTQTDHAAAVLIKELFRLANTRDDLQAASKISQAFAVQQKNIPVTDAAYEFVDQQIIQATSPQVQQSALIYFAFQQDSRAVRWVEHFTDARVDPDLQSAALYRFAFFTLSQVFSSGCTGSSVSFPGFHLPRRGR
jgi:hypothetical protein